MAYYDLVGYAARGGYIATGFLKSVHFASNTCLVDEQVEVVPRCDWAMEAKNSCYLTKTGPDDRCILCGVEPSEPAH
jgi:hypothetical protein